MYLNYLQEHECTTSRNKSIYPHKNNANEK